MPLTALPGCGVVGEAALRGALFIEVSRGGKALLFAISAAVMLLGCWYVLGLFWYLLSTGLLLALTVLAERERERARALRATSRRSWVSGLSAAGPSTANSRINCSSAARDGKRRGATASEEVLRGR